ncbi:unnamed protein product [Arctogadus glacialis]
MHQSREVEALGERGGLSSPASDTKTLLLTPKPPGPVPQGLIERRSAHTPPTYIPVSQTPDSPPVRRPRWWTFGGDRSFGMAATP